MGKQKLIIVGAGPKAIAMASKNAVLAELGYEVPELHIIEKSHVAANWTGKAGFTNGKQPLGTSPEKDVGFPYQSKTWGDKNEEVNFLMQKFSWHSFLMSRGLYSDWVDRGRQQPKHLLWADYLQWTLNKLKGELVQVHHGELKGVDFEGPELTATYSSSGAENTIKGNGLVITGPGQIRLPPGVRPSKKVFTVESFWENYLNLKANTELKICIAGAGENAASMACSLIEDNPNAKIDIICPNGAIFSRGESFFENRIYSDPDRCRWNDLDSKEKMEVIKRTDRGVFSIAAMKMLNDSTQINILPGRVVGVEETETNVGINVSYNGKEEFLSYDRMAFAIGEDQLQFLGSLLRPEDRMQIIDQLGVPTLDNETISPLIDFDLSVKGLENKLHLPMLSGLAQGPGFSNLSCLGRLSDRVLSSYVH